MSPNPLIIALDSISPRKALTLVRRLKLTGVAFKIGYDLFSQGGHRFVDQVISHDVRVFLDLKFHDIPNTVGRVSQLVTNMGVWMFNVHASGGIDMMKAALEASHNEARKRKIKPPLVLGVTVLTSLDDLKEINVSLSVKEQVISLAGLAHQAKLDGVVCSALEASEVKKECGKSFVIVTPGIRLALGLALGPESSSHHDQKRVQTPKEAIAQGANYLVIGRPVTESLRPTKVVSDILSSLLGS